MVGTIRVKKSVFDGMAMRHDSARIHQENLFPNRARVTFEHFYSTHKKFTFMESTVSTYIKRRCQKSSKIIWSKCSFSPGIKQKFFGVVFFRTCVDQNTIKLWKKHTFKAFIGKTFAFTVFLLVIFRTKHPEQQFPRLNQKSRSDQTNHFLGNSMLTLLY